MPLSLKTHRRTLVSLLALALMLASGCKKKEKTVPPPQAQAPPVTAPAPETKAPEPTQPTPEVTAPETPAATAAPAEQPATSENKTPSKTSTRNHKARAAKKPSPVNPAKPSPPASGSASTTAAAGTVASNSPSAAPHAPAPTPTPAASSSSSADSNPGQIAPGMSATDEYHSRQTTAQLIDGCESSLRGINRKLSEDEQATVSQIRNYIAQSRTATTQNDLERANNLALKAHLLCDALVKR